MHRQRLAMTIAAGLGVLATFMPWVNVPLIGSVPGTQGDGWITLVIFAIALLPALANDRARPLVGTQLVAFAAAGAICAAIGIWKILDLKRAMGGIDESNPFAQALSASVSIGFGLYLVVGAGIALVLLGFALKDPESATVPGVGPAPDGDGPK